MKYLLDTNIISEPMKPEANIGVMNRLAVESIFSCTSADEIINIQPIGSKAKPYQIKQIRNIFLKYKLGNKNV